MKELAPVHITHNYLNHLGYVCICGGCLKIRDLILGHTRRQMPKHTTWFLSGKNSCHYRMLCVQTYKSPLLGPILKTQDSAGCRGYVERSHFLDKPTKIGFVYIFIYMDLQVALGTCQKGRIWHGSKFGHQRDRKICQVSPCLIFGQKVWTASQSTHKWQTWLDDAWWAHSVSVNHSWPVKSGELVCPRFVGFS